MRKRARQKRVRSASRTASPRPSAGGSDTGFGRRARDKAASKERGRKLSLKSQSAWPEILGEAVIIALVIAVPIVINIGSRNINDVKDVTLGLGVAFGLGIWLIASLARGRLSWASSRLNVAVLAFTAWSAVSIIYSRYRYATVSEFGRLAAHVGLFILAIACLRALSQVRRVIAAAAVASVPICIYGFFQAGGRDFVEWSTRVTRIFSFLGNPTYLGGFLILVIPLVLAAAWPVWRREDMGQGGRRRYLASALLTGTAVMMALCLYYSRTLGGIIGLALAAPLTFVLGIVRGGRRALPITLPASIAAAFVLALVGFLGWRHMPPGDQARVQQILYLHDPHADERALHRRVSLGMFAQHPILGEGYGSFRVSALEDMAAEWYAQDMGRAEQMLMPGYAHNEYLQVAGDTGIVGAVLFIAFLLGGYALAIRVGVRHPDPGWAVFGLAAAGSMTAFLFQNFFGVTFRQTGAVTFFWLSLALMVVARATVPGQGAGQAPPRLRELHFAPRSAPSLLALSLVLAGALAVLSWLTIRPVLASSAVREAQALALAENFEASAYAAERALQLCPYSALAYYVAAYAWGKTRQFDKAIEANKRALGLSPGNASIYYNLAVSYKEKGDYKTAEQYFREAVKLMPTNSRHHAALAEMLLAQGRLAEAEAEVQEALRIEPGNYQIRLLLGEVYSKQGRPGDLADALEEASRQAPTNVKLKEQLVSLLLTMGQYERAAPVSKEWVQMDPSSPGAYNALGVCYFNQGLYVQAKQEFLRAVEFNPDYWRARVNLASSHLKLQELPAALEQLRYVIGHAPNAPEAQEAKATLAAITRGPRPAQAGSAGGGPQPAGVTRTGRGSAGP